MVKPLKWNLFNSDELNIYAHRYLRKLRFSIHCNSNHPSMIIEDNLIEKAGNNLKKKLLVYGFVSNKLKETVIKIIKSEMLKKISVLDESESTKIDFIKIVENEKFEKIFPAFPVTLN